MEPRIYKLYFLIVFTILHLNLSGCSVKEISSSVELNKPINKVSNTQVVTPSRIENRNEATLYFPKGYNPKIAYPIIYVFRHDADANASVHFWRDLSDKHQFIIWASKGYKNDMENLALKRLMDSTKFYVERISDRILIDKRRVYFTSLSGGGSFSEALLLTYPHLASGIIVNTGRIWDQFYNNAQKSDRLLTLTFIKSKPQIILLASPADFRYEEMKRDKLFFQKLGCKVQWIEFEGGHTFAPKQIYDSVLKEVI